MKISNLRVEYKHSPLGMDEARPRFSWSCRSRQKWYRIVVKKGDHVSWDSGKCEGDRQFQVEYDGETLQPFTRYTWSVETNGGASESYFATGFMGSPWTAPWISAGHRQQCGDIRSFRMDFEGKDVVHASLYVTALGIYEAFLNGGRVGRALLTPGYTQYDQRVQYQCYDLDSQLENGNNALVIDLVNGWYCGLIAHNWSEGQNRWGDYPQLRAEIRLELADGTEKVLPMNPDTTRYGDILNYADMYHGEEVEGWRLERLKTYGKDYWAAVPLVEEETHPRIEWNSGEDVLPQMTVLPKTITRRPNGAYIVDFGQNLVGYEQFELRKNIPGTVIFIRHGEMLNKDGSLYYENLRRAKARTIYTSGNGASESFEPRFTTYGFRYLEVTGWPGRLDKRSIRAVVVSSALQRTGTFSSSSDMLNKLYSNIIWGQRSNFVDIPTDCPQRDERYGWTGDTQVFANVATYNMDGAAFYTKWIRDLNLSASPEGPYLRIVPNPYALSPRAKVHDGITGWSDAGVVCPWTMLLKYADARLVKTYMPQILAWLDWEIDQSKGTYILNVAHYNDWLHIGWEDDRMGANGTPGDYLSSAYLAGMLSLAARMLRLVGDHREAHRREHMAQEARNAFAQKFLKDGKPVVTSQTALLMALNWDLFGVDTPAAKTAADLLVKNIRDINHCHLTTGFLGTPLLLDVLSKLGQVDLAYDLLLQESYPGWLYPVTQGATTMWERWNSYTHDKGFGNVGMNSFNHYAYGAVGAWFYEHICGIQPLSDSPDDLGFHHFALAPEFGHRLDTASATFEALSGTIRSEWKRQGDGTIQWSFTVPPNATAEIRVKGDYDLVPGLEKKDGAVLAHPGNYQLKIANC